MSEELKTLKDLFEGFYNRNILKEISLSEVEDELKAEAIKHIKFLRENKWLAEDIIEKAKKLSPEEVIVNYIMWQNNISDEDLK